MSFTVQKLGRWNRALDALVAESRALPGVPADEARRFHAWVDGEVDRIRHREISALVACEDEAPVALAGYVRKGEIIRVRYLYMRASHQEPLSAFLRRAEGCWRPVRRVIIEGGPQSLLDEAVGADGFLRAGYQRFERARFELRLDAPIIAPADLEPDPAIIPLPANDIEALVRLQHEGYIGSPDYLLIDDFEAMVHELLRDPWFAPETSYAISDGEELVAALYTYHKGSTGWVASLCVHPKARGQGLARRLMEHSLAAYRAAGFRRAGLHVTLENVPATRLYENLGFRLAERKSLLYAREMEPEGAAEPSVAALEDRA